MFPQVKSSRYPHSSLPDEFFKQAHLITASTEYVVPLPVMVSRQCKHTCGFIFMQDKLASVYMGRIVNPNSILKDICATVNLLVGKGLPLTYDNLVKVSTFCASEEISMPVGVVLFLPEEKGVVYRYILESYIAAMYDFIFYLFSHRAINALADVRIKDITMFNLILYFDQGIV